MLYEIGIHALKPFAQRDRGAPAERIDARDVEQLARRAVRLRRVELDLARIADHVGDNPRELRDRDVLAGADIEELQVRIALHHEDAGIGEIVDREEFALRRSGAPDHDIRIAVELGFMETTHQSRRHVAVERMIIVAGTIEIGRHHRYEVRAVLQAIGFAQFDAGDLGDAVPLVGRLDRRRSAACPAASAAAPRADKCKTSRDRRAS